MVYRFDSLEEELAAAAGRRSRTHERSTSTLEQARTVPSNTCMQPVDRVFQGGACWSRRALFLRTHACNLLTESSRAVHAGAGARCS